VAQHPYYPISLPATGVATTGLSPSPMQDFFLPPKPATTPAPLTSSHRQ